MTRFKHVANAKRYAARTRQWVFNDENGNGFVVVGSKMADELIQAGLRPVFSPFSSIRISN